MPGSGPTGSSRSDAGCLKQPERTYCLRLVFAAWVLAGPKYPLHATSASQPPSNPDRPRIRVASINLRDRTTRVQGRCENEIDQAPPLNVPLPMPLPCKTDGFRLRGGAGAAGRLPRPHQVGTVSIYQGMGTGMGRFKGLELDQF